MLNQQISFLSHWSDLHVLTRTRKKKKKVKSREKRDTSENKWFRKTESSLWVTGEKQDGGQGESSQDRQSLHVGTACRDRKMFQVSPLKVGQYICQADKNLLSQFTGGREREKPQIWPRRQQTCLCVLLNAPFSSHIRAWNHVNVKLVAKLAHPL